MTWEHFEHGADIGIRGIGSTKSQAFEQAALALTAVVTDPERVEPRLEQSFRLEAPDDELLFTGWIDALVYEMAVGKMLFSEFEVHLNGTLLEAKARGEHIAPGRHELAVEVKGATYTALAVREDETGQWVAQCVVDV